MKDLKGLLEQMTLEEKIGQLVQYTAGLLDDTEEELTGPMIRAGLTAETKAYVGTVIGGLGAENICDLQPMLRFWNNEHKYVSEPGVFQISTGYADHLIYTKELTLEA